MIERVQYAPRQGVTFEPSLDVLIPALERLRACRDKMDVLVLTDQVPDIILPALAWVASRKTYIPHFAVETLVKCCGAAISRKMPREVAIERAVAALPKTGCARWLVPVRCLIL